MPLPLDALALLACPACHAPLREEAQAVACTGCGRLYPVVDGIPILLVERATEASDKQ